MSGFEVIVRPVVLPNIRPAPPRVLAPEDDPSAGIATLGGAGGKLIDMTQSEQHSWSRTKAVETKRKFVTERVYKVNPDGTVDKSTYIDVERIQDVTTRDGNGIEQQVKYADPPQRDNVENIIPSQERINQEAQG
jgi:hypothetical protein